MSVSISLEELWSQQNDFPLSARALEAISTVSGPLFLPAGPGAGKTTVLLWRTLNLIVYHDVNPEEIFLSTFTEKAARQLKDGLTSMLADAQKYTTKKYDTSRMYVGTVHSLCQKLVGDRRFAGRTQRLPAILDDIDQYLLVSDVWQQLLTEAGLEGDSAQTSEQLNVYLRGVKSSSRHDAIANCITFFNRCADEYIDIDAMLSHAQGDDILHAVLTMCRAYRRILESRGAADFGSIQLHALSLLRASSNARSQFKHVIIDEYQDTNPIQEQIFFELARGHTNLCVVGDDDQALYRFRGATVENFVMFKETVRTILGKEAKEIALDTNYRSHPGIVNLYNTYMRDSQFWTANGHMWRVRKTIKANPQLPAAVAAQRHAATIVQSGPPADVAKQVAEFIKRLLDEGRITDPNQVAVLFKSVKSTKAKSMIAALEAVGLKPYAPRAGRFLEVDEATDMLGVLMQFTGKPTTEWQLNDGDFKDYLKWADTAHKRGAEIVQQDPFLRKYVDDRKQFIAERVRDRERLLAALTEAGIEADTVYKPDTEIGKRMKKILLASNASSEALKPLRRKRFDDVAMQRFREGKPLVAMQLVARATTFDFGLLDMFYQLQGFRHFKTMLDVAQEGSDEGPIVNIAMLSRYLARFIDTQRSALLSARDFTNDSLLRRLWMRYIYVLFKRGESEYEDEEMMFPSGRVPFLTIHQSKGLEFPVVVLGSPQIATGQKNRLEELMRTLVQRGREREPLHRIEEFDAMRLFYVAMSRAKHVCVLTHYRGAGHSAHQSIKNLITAGRQYLTDMDVFDVKTVPQTNHEQAVIQRRYSYTSDYLSYESCARQYMIFRKYDFAPSRTPYQMFGSLVHRTIEEIHGLMIDARNGGQTS